MKLSKLFSVLIGILIWLSCQSVLKSQLVYSGIEKDTQTFVFAEQHSPAWIWAANVQIILNYHNSRLSQEDIIKQSFKLTNPYANLPIWSKNLKSITTNLNGWKINYNNSKYILHLKYFEGSPSPQLLLDELTKNDPVILFDSTVKSGDRSYICTAIGFLPGYYGKIVKEVLIRDVTNNCSDDWDGQKIKWNIKDIPDIVAGYWLTSVTKENPHLNKRHYRKK